MKPSLLTVFFCAGASLALACDKADAGEAGPAKAARADTKSAPAPAPVEGAAQAAPTAPANPHAIPPHANLSKNELGPPQDVTPSGTTRSETVDGLVMAVPEEWSRGEVSGKMRKGAFIIPGPGGDAELLVYRFAGGAGSAAQNIERWKGQIEGGEAKTTELESNGLTISAVDVAGRFGGSAMPGVPPTPAIEQARLLAASVSGSGDPWYLKVVGPAKTLDVWSEAWTKVLDSLKGT